MNLEDTMLNEISQRKKKHMEPKKSRTHRSREYNGGYQELGDGWGGLRGGRCWSKGSSLQL